MVENEARIVIMPASSPSETVPLRKPRELPLRRRFPQQAALRLRGAGWRAIFFDFSSASEFQKFYRVLPPLTMSTSAFTNDPMEEETVKPFLTKVKQKITALYTENKAVIKNVALFASTVIIFRMIAKRAR